MLANFDFLKDFDETLYKLGNRIEKQISSSPSGVKADATTFLEHLLSEMLLSVGLKYNPRKNFYSQLDAVYRAEKIDYKYKDSIYSAYTLRSHIHDKFEDIESNEFAIALQLHRKLFYIAKKYYRDSDRYDEYKGVPEYRAPQLDLTSKEVDLIEIPDFSDLVEVKYDYCVICGEPNHASHSIFCEACNLELDNANNYISIRNHFGRDAEFTKDDLIKYGIPEAYATQFVNSVIKLNLLKQKGRLYTFNSMHLEEYLAKIDRYISIGELITKFKEDKITPAEIKQTKEYKQGSFKQAPFEHFFRVINEEIVYKFEKELLSSHDVYGSIEFSTLSQNEVNRWYNINLNHYRRGNINKAFILFNELLIQDYLDSKRDGVLDSVIEDQLHITPEMHEFWAKTHKEFYAEIKQIKKELLLKAIKNGCTKMEAIEYAGVTQKEYDGIVKVSDFNDDEFSRQRNEEVELRKENFIRYLKDDDIETAASKARITVDDFYKWYDKADLNSHFYIESTKILMDKYLNEKRKGKLKAEICQSIGLKEKYVDRWLKRNIDIYKDFRQEELKVTVDLIIKGFKEGKSKKEIANALDIDVKVIDRHIKVGERGDEIFKPLYEYYQSNVVPQQLDKFLNKVKTSKYKKALKAADLSQDDLKQYYILGLEGDENFKEFSEKYFDYKLEIYIKEVINKGKTPQRASRNANFIDEDYKYRGSEINDTLIQEELDIVIPLIDEGYLAKSVANKVNFDVEVLFDWYVKGYEGDETFKEFSQSYWENRMEPAIADFQALFDKGISEKFFLKNIIRKDVIPEYKFWKKLGVFEFKTTILDEKEQIEVYKETITEVKKNFKKAMKYKEEDSEFDVPIKEMLEDIDDSDLKKEVKDFLKENDEND